MKKEAKHIITLVSYGTFDRKLIRTIADVIRSDIGMEVRIAEKRLDLSPYYNIERRQYDGNRLLKLVDEQFSTTEGKVVALFNVDLFIPILTFIFGQAYLNGKTAIASNFRLENEHYGLKPDKELCKERLIKEVVHELGHTLGLIHCHTPDCVMRSSTYVEDIDQKKHTFCHKHQEKLRNTL